LSLLLIFLLLCSGSTKFSFGQGTKFSPATRTQLEKVTVKFMTENSVPGLSVAVVKNGEFVWSEGLGMADLENLVPATSNTLYRLASISKPLTATAAMQLWERGRLNLDAPVQLYCPGFPQKEWQITTRELLGHLGGIRHYRGNSPEDPEFGNTKHFDDPIQSGLNFFANDPLVAKPGTEFHYSTQGYTLVGCVIEGASGQKYVDYMRENIFARVGMASTRTDDGRAVIQRRTRFYHNDKNAGVVNANFLDSSYKIPGGGWLSSADDMARFEVAILNDRLVQPATRDLMWNSQTDLAFQHAPLESIKSYGLGWEVTKGTDFVNIGHWGDQQGTSTFIMLAPAYRAGVVVLMNLDGVDGSAIAAQLLKIIISPPEITSSGSTMVPSP
jgi:serine beta-lactamase-like protein LACTB, mitochondrial